MNLSRLPVLLLAAALALPAPAAPVKLIFDTDMGNDVDDLMALILIHNLQKRGACELLAVTVTKDHPQAAAFVDAVNTLYGHPDTPIGVVRNGAAREPGKFNLLADEKNADGSFRYPHDLRSGADAPEAVGLLRQILAGQPDGSVTLAQVGFFSNFARLLDSPPDEYSSFTGRELIRQKVKLLSIMAGAFQTIDGDNRFLEYNVKLDVPAAQKLARDWPSPVVWSGFEIGIAAAFPHTVIEHDLNYLPHHPLKEAYYLYEPPPHDRPTWDPTAVLYAIFPERGYYNLSPPGRVTVADDAATWFRPGKDGSHRYLVMSQEQATRVREAIVQLSAEPPPAPAPRRLSRAALLDKIKGAWAGQMIGVSYGAPTEFRFQGKTIDGEIRPDEISNAIAQDDLYVEMTFARVMDTVGLEATSKDFGEAFRQSKYNLWHANAAARRNLNRGIAAPLSGHPRYNLHADDIDFQIEADFIGIMCPGLTQAANRFADRVGRVMNYGDGLYGGQFIAGMYSAGFFESNPRKVVEGGLACIPAESTYGRLIRDLLNLAERYPDDWRRVWRELGEKWDKDDPCPEGALAPYNIDAKLNGAYVAFGLLFGGGDWMKTMEIATRCGQDSDCNPSSAAGVLGAMIGWSRIPEKDRAEVSRIAGRKFDFTEYSFNDIVASTEKRACEVIRREGGRVGEAEVEIPVQLPQPPPLEQCDFGVPTRVVPTSDAAWTWRGNWSRDRETKVATGAGAEVTLTFTGTGVALLGPLTAEGGRADVWVDDRKSELLADAFIVERTHDNALWHVNGLPPGKHTIRLVTTDAADPRSKGKTVGVEKAILYSARGTPAK